VAWWLKGSLFKGSVQRKIRWVRKSTNLWLLTGTMALEIFWHIVSQHFVQNIFPFSVSTAKLNAIWGLIDEA
jgi:hypothetical protein